MKRILLLTLLVLSVSFSKAQTATCGTIPFTVTVTQTQQILCNGQCTAELTATVTGGVGPFALQWTGGGPAGPVYGNLCAGTYTLLIIDGGQGQTCIVTAIVTQPMPLTTITTQMAPSCTTACDGIIAGTQSGGTPPYTIAWTNLTTGLPMGSNPTQTGICNGQYQFCVTDANGCTDCDIITVNTTTPCAACTLFVATNIQPAICTSSTGVACVAVTGGSGNYSYQWGASAGSQTTSCATAVPAGSHCVTITDVVTLCDTVICVNVGTTTSPMVATAIPTAATCFGVCNGTAVGFATGGTPPYQYSIDGGMTWITSGNFSGLCAGTYILQAMDANGCQAIYTFMVTQPPALTLLATPTQPSCATACDGSISVTATGGTGTLQYSNDGGSSYQSGNTFNGLCNGVYQVCVQDANGCFQCVNVTLNATNGCNPCGFTIVSTTQPATCTAANGAACVNVTGGTGPYVYGWSVSAGSQTTACASNLPAGNHCVTIFDQGNSNCDSTICVTVNTTTSTIVTTATSTGATCNNTCDGTVTVMSFGGTPPMTYSLDNGPYQSSATFTGVCPGTHIAYAKDANGCIGLYTIIVSNPTPVIAVANPVQLPSTATSCNGILVGNASGGTPTYVYAWYDSTGTQVGSGPTLPNACSGNYVLCATDVNGCSNCDSLNVPYLNTVNENISLSFSMYPNPTNGDTWIRFNQPATGIIQIVDAIGRIKYSQKIVGQRELKIDLSSEDWTTGLYIVKITGNSVSHAVRLIKK